MKKLLLEIPDRQSWFEHVQTDANGLILFCPTANAPRVGQVALVDIQFATGCRLFIHGMTIWRRKQTSAHMQAGAGILVASSDLPKMEFLNGYARGGLVDRREGNLRLPVRINVIYKTESGRRMNFTRNIHKNGISLGCAEFSPVGSILDLKLLFPQGLGTCSASGNIVRHIEDSRGKAMAVELTFPTQDVSDRYDKTLEELEQLLTSGELPEEYLI
ncbi:MAG: hypothetical protein J7M25_06480 [Deltaproteobacteria bacterium]|nr:hypothetical protein [Deltaproteobacteria bacterium]